MKHKTFRTRPVKAGLVEQLNHRQSLIEGFSLAAYQTSRVVIIGAGGLGTNIGQGASKKGLRQAAWIDDDRVGLSDLPRQLFSRKDLGRNKAICAARRFSRESCFEGICTGYPYRFREMLDSGHDFSQYDALVCAVDNNTTRVDVSATGLRLGVPVVHAAVSRDGSRLYSAVQEPGKACFACMMPHALNDNTYPCNLPGIIDVLQVAAGLVVYALDTIICSRYREWNLKSICLDGSMPDQNSLIARNPACQLCGHVIQRKDVHDEWIQPVP